MKPLLVIVLAVSAASCSNGGNPQTYSGQDALSSAERAVEVFRAQISSGDFDEIYENSTQSRWVYGSRDRVITMLKAASATLGEFSCGVINGPAASRNDDGSWYVSFNYLSSFENGGAAEVFYFRVSNGGAQLMDYRVQPDVFGLAKPRSIWLSNLSPLTARERRQGWSSVEALSKQS